MPVDRDTFRKGCIIARPLKTPPDQTPTRGELSLHLDSKKDGLLYVPHNYQPDKPTPLAVLLHGAGGNAHHGLTILQHVADAANIILLAPASRQSSWDIIDEERFGPDIIFMDGALTKVFQNYNIDTTRLAIGGFSDGASYALSVGLINGDLFTHILAFSPGFAYAPNTQGNPRIYVSHGVQDDILPIQPCSRRLVPKLQKQGYQLIYREFDGPHIIPPEISQEAVQWFISA